MKGDDDWRARAGHSPGRNVGLGDGCVRLVAGSASRVAWTAVLRPQGGGAPGLDW